MAAKRRADKAARKGVAPGQGPAHDNRAELAEQRIAEGRLVDLRKEDVEFFARHDIPLWEVFDASGMRLRDYKLQMGLLGCRVAIGVKPCLHGHAIRNRHGKCAVCQPKTFTFSARFHKPMTLYVAHSRATGLIKVGISEDIDDRLHQMRVHKYAACSDWEVMESFDCPDAGRVEYDIHVRLCDFRVRADYGSRPESCNELFKCAPSVALKELRRAKRLAGQSG